MPESTDKMTVIHCCICDIEFWLTSRFADRLTQNHNQFFCPVGHAQKFKEPVKEEVKPKPEVKAANLFRRVKLG